jgi:hypothetical protein
MRASQEFRGGLSSVGHQIKGSARQLDAAGVWILSGTDAPTESVANGSIYLQTGPGGGAFWIRMRDSWTNMTAEGGER